MKARCPKCGQKLSFGEEAVGRRGRCGGCGQHLAVLRQGRLYCIEIHPCEKTVVTPSKLVVGDISESDHPPDMPRPRQFRFGDHVGMYQPWSLLLIFGALIAAVVSLAAFWPISQQTDMVSIAPAPPGTTVVGSPAAPSAPILDAVSSQQTRPAVSATTNPRD